ncbi:MAG: RNA polymerase sigma factor, partial [Bacteroidales bacterium]|nr:RNA polymerase sigma factor [Bacteroidales bacterium]
MNTTEYNNCVSQFADGVYRFVYKNLRDADGSKDIVQEAFARLWERRDGVDGSKAKSYLFTAAYHLIIDRSRKNHETPLVDGFDTFQTAFRQYSDIKEVLDDAVAHLPSDQRSVIMLRDYEGYAYDEIAQITG